MTRSRRGRCFSAAELDRFIEQLRATGNMTLAAERIGRPGRGLENRRRYDPDFNARCEAALAIFRAHPPDASERVPKAGGHRGQRSLRTSGGEFVVTRGGPVRGAQLRRARPGRLTDAALTLFLRTVSATANLSLAARSIGVSYRAIAERRTRDVSFDQQVIEALKEGCARLETQLLESALRGLRDPSEDEGEVAAVGADDVDGYAPQLPPMTAHEAVMFLERQRELLSRRHRWSAERDRQTLDLATARLEKLMKRLSLEPTED